MDKLWAPWRMEFLESKKVSGCVFCRALRGKEKKHIVHTGKKTFVIMNLYPYTNGHVMVVPKRHLADLEKLSKPELSELTSLTIRCTKALKKVYGAQGFNIGLNIGKAAGAGIKGHLHVHVVPRWVGDTNFMPITARTKVISESIADSYRKLKGYFSDEKK